MIELLKMMTDYFRITRRTLIYKELAGQMVELVVRLIDAREIRTSKGLTYR